MNKKYFLSEWFTVQDCLGLPFFPTSANNIRRNLEKMVKGAPGEESKKVRKKAKGKGNEYHISILPPHLLDAVAISTWEEGEEPVIATSSAPVSNFDIWVMIYKKLSPAQQQRAIDLFFDGGVNALMPAVLLGTATDNNTEQEILLQRDSIDDTIPTPHLKTHGKKAG